MSREDIARRLKIKINCDRNFSGTRYSNWDESCPDRLIDISVTDFWNNFWEDDAPLGMIAFHKYTKCWATEYTKWKNNNSVFTGSAEVKNTSFCS